MKIEMHGIKRVLSAFFTASLSVSVWSTSLHGQGIEGAPADFATGSELEEYMRALQVAGKVPVYPWSVRGFSPLEVDSLAKGDSLGVWALRPRGRRGVAPGPLHASGIVNTTYPYGSNDGPVWAGRGFTGVVSGGLSLRAGPFSVILQPVAFIATNGSFPLFENGKSGRLAFNNGSYPGSIDWPQRFGDGAYGRIDPGASTIRVDTRFVTAGISTANEWIGPATTFPFLLGNNAPGFPHLFVGTGMPVNIGVGRLHGRLIWGKLSQSDYSPVTGPERFQIGVSPGTTRLATSGELVITPRGLPGLELGLARFFHVPYAAGEPSMKFWRKPFRVVFLKNEYAQGDTLGQDNQLASVFFRWVFPKSGFEFFGERGYEDQIYDFREFLQDIDHDREYMLGFQKITGSDPARMNVLRGEIVNYQLTTLARLRHEGFIYLHSTLPQGHTNQGQLLGSSSGAGSAAASILSWTRYSSQGRSAFTFRRIVRDDRGRYYQTGIEDRRGSDVLVTLGLERMQFGRRADFGFRVEAMRNYNRNFASDVNNLNLLITTRLHPW